MGSLAAMDEAMVSDAVIDLCDGAKQVTPVSVYHIYIPPTLTVDDDYFMNTNSSYLCFVPYHMIQWLINQDSQGGGSAESAVCGALVGIAALLQTAGGKGSATRDDAFALINRCILMLLSLPCILQPSSYLFFFLNFLMFTNPPLTFTNSSTRCLL